MTTSRVLRAPRVLLACFALVSAACAGPPAAAPTVVSLESHAETAPAADAPPAAAPTPAAATSVDVVAAPAADSPASSPDDDLELHGVRYGYQIIYEVAGGAPAAFEAAHSAFDQATEAGDAHRDGEAARYFLACAAHYRAVPASARERLMADANARICYYDAAYAYANAGELAAHGRAALVDAARADPRMRSYVEELLADLPGELPRSGAR